MSKTREHLTFIVGSLLMAALGFLAACSTPTGDIQSPFDPSDFNFITQEGAATLHVQVAIRADDGSVHHGPGATAFITPFNSYSANMARIMKSGQTLPSLDTRLQSYSRSVLIGKVGGAKFEKLPPGQYLVWSLVEQKLRRNYFKSYTFAVVQLGRGETRHVTIGAAGSTPIPEIAMRSLAPLAGESNINTDELNQFQRKGQSTLRCSIRVRTDDRLMIEGRGEIAYLIPLTAGVKAAARKIRDKELSGFESAFLAKHAVPQIIDRNGNCEFTGVGAGKYLVFAPISRKNHSGEVAEAIAIGVADLSGGRITTLTVGRSDEAHGL